MFNYQSSLAHTLPGEPTPEALHREEYYHEKTEATETSEVVDQGRIERRARLLRAQMLATVGRYFA